MWFRLFLRSSWPENWKILENIPLFTLFRSYHSNYLQFPILVDRWFPGYPPSSRTGNTSLALGWCPTPEQLARQRNPGVSLSHNPDLVPLRLSLHVLIQRNMLDCPYLSISVIVFAGVLSVNDAHIPSRASQQVQFCTSAYHFLIVPVANASQQPGINYRTHFQHRLSYSVPFADACIYDHCWKRSSLMFLIPCAKAHLTDVFSTEQLILSHILPGFLFQR